MESPDKCIVIIAVVLMISLVIVMVTGQQFYIEVKKIEAAKLECLENPAKNNHNTTN